jgi:GDP-L-fucose synthase
MTNNEYTNTQMSKDSKIFVAGGTGLVGSAIIKNLISKGYKNIVANYHNRKPVTNNQLPITWEKLDLTSQIEVAKFFEDEKPEYVILAAAKVGGIVANNTYRGEFIYENLAIQNNVIHQSYVNGVKKLLFLGSTCIYPKEAPQPMPENCLLTSPLEYTNEPYAIAKIAGIKMCESYNLQYGTNFISVMPTNLYGPNDNFDLEKSHVLPALIRKIHCAKLLYEGREDEVAKELGIENIDEAKEYLEGFGVDASSVEIWGTGKPRREFLYSEDMADACVFLLENRDFSDVLEPRTCSGQSLEELPGSQKPKEVRNTHINIGTGVDISIKELAELIQKIIGFEGELKFNINKPDGTMVKLTDPSKLHSLGWKHKVELEDGIKTMYEWYLNSK